MSDMLVRIAELIGVASAAISGVLTAAQASLDLFGALVLGCLTAVGGGIIRDLLLGVIPPATFRNPTILLVAAGVSLVVFFLQYFYAEKLEYSRKRYEQLLNGFDAVGLAMFVIIGIDAAKTAGYKDNAFLTVFVGVVTGIGGGMLRDITIGKIPVVLQKHIYALAAVFGALLYVFLPRLGCPDAIALYVAVAGILFIRYFAARYHWNMPRFPQNKQE